MLENIRKGLNIDDQNLTNRCFADNIVLLFDKLKDITMILQEIYEVCSKVHLRIDISKIKYMTIPISSVKI